MGLNIQHISPLFRVLRRQAFHTRHLTPEFQMGKPIGIGGGFFVQGVIDPAGFPGFVAPHHFEAVFQALHPHHGAVGEVQVTIIHPSVEINGSEKSRVAHLKGH